MAKVIAACKCAVCGADFERVEHFRNPGMADDWKKWAEEAFVECPACRAKRKSAENAAKAAIYIKRYGLPEITGKSDRQIRRATELRNCWLAEEDEETLESYDFLEGALRDPKHPLRARLQKVADEQADGDLDEAADFIILRYRLAVCRALWHESSASVIIHTLS